MANVKTRPIAKESMFSMEELFFSRTDRRGVIVAGNSVFVRVSGYSTSELVNSPHNIIRHPDMPKCVFELFWDFLKAGKPVCAYVKNMANDGSFYWVFAAAYPIEGGFISIRLKPSSPIFAVVESLYREILSLENEKGVKAARSVLEERIPKLGFKNYSEFMIEALIQEIQSRQKILSERKLGDRQESLRPLSWLNTKVDRNLTAMAAESKELSGHCLLLFRVLIKVVESTQTMSTQSDRTLNRFANLKFLVLNMTVAAEKLGKASRSLVAISECFQELAQQIKGTVDTFKTTLNVLREAIQDAEFKCGSSQLQAEMISVFTLELLESASNASENEEAIKSCRILRDLVDTYLSSIKLSLEKVEVTLDAFAQKSEELNSIVSGLEVIRLRGLIESSQLLNDKSFGAHIEGMGIFIGEIRSALSTLFLEARRAQEALRDTRDPVTESLKRLTEISDDLSRLTHKRASEERSKLLA